MSYRIALEGLDGAGKTTVAKILAATYGATHIANPGGTPLSAALRKVLLDAHDIARTPLEDAIMFTASSISVLNEAFNLAIRGRRVVIDRMPISDRAYRYGDGFDDATMDRIHALIPQNLLDVPTYFIDVPEETRHARLKNRGDGKLDRMEARPVTFHRRVAYKYQQMRNSMIVVAGNVPPEEVARRIAAHAGWHE